jgi:SAM-dependent methyltransferase
MPLMSYDHAVTYYDTTRGYPQGVSEQIRDAIIDHVNITPSTQFLELAIGTGIIGIPFMEQGYAYTGVDISAQMMAQISRKLAPTQHLPQLVQSNVMNTLPFAPQTFDVILAVRILHLLDDWQSALNAVLPILKPKGKLVIAHETFLEDRGGFDPIVMGHRIWHEILADLGIPKGSSRQRLWQKAPAIMDYLTDAGLQTEIVDLCYFMSDPVSLRMQANRHRDRIFSTDWQLPDAIHSEAVKRYDHYLEHDCPNPDEAVSKRLSFRAIIAH